MAIKQTSKNGSHSNGLDGDPESFISQLAADGSLGKAARTAIRRQRAKGIPLTFKRGNKVIKRYKDGHEQVLAQLKTTSYRLPDDVRRIGR